LPFSGLKTFGTE
jgi:hypothetical protein